MEYFVFEGTGTRMEVGIALEPFFHTHRIFAVATHPETMNCTRFLENHAKG